MIFKNDIYDIIIAQNDDYYISSIKELGIHESGSNEQESLSKCISKRDAYFNYCKANINDNSDHNLIEKINDRFILCTIYKDNKYVSKIHSQLFIQDGIRLIRSSSNITDRSLGLYPCDKEYGLLPLVV